MADDRAQPDQVLPPVPDLCAIARAGSPPPADAPDTALDSVVDAAVVMRNGATRLVRYAMSDRLAPTDCTDFADSLEELAKAVRVMAGTLVHREALPPAGDE
jgi:hypothetical protein